MLACGHADPTGQRWPSCPQFGCRSRHPLVPTTAYAKDLGSRLSSLLTGVNTPVLSRYTQCINRVFYLPNSTCEEVSCANLGCGNAHFHFQAITRVEPRDNVSCKQLNTVHYLQYFSLHGHRQTSLARRNGLGSFPASRIAVVAANSKCRPKLVHRSRAPGHPTSLVVGGVNIPVINQ